MKIKWKEDYSAKTQRYWGVIIGGIAGVLITLVAQGIYTSWAIFAKAPWWEVFTALGTVGAVGFALYQSIKLNNIKLNEERLQAEGMLSLFNEGVESLLWVAGHLEECLSKGTQPMKSELSDFIVSAKNISKIPFYQNPYSKYHGILIAVVSKIRWASYELTAHIHHNQTLCATSFREQADFADACFADALESELCADLRKPGPAYFLPARSESRAG